MKYKKGELTLFAKDCASGAYQMLSGICIAEEIAKTKLCRELISEICDDELILEVSKRFAKYAKDELAFDVENGTVQDFQRLIYKIVECCDENNWFDN